MCLIGEFVRGCADIAEDPGGVLVGFLVGFQVRGGAVFEGGLGCRTVRGLAVFKSRAMTNSGGLAIWLPSRPVAAITGDHQAYAQVTCSLPGPRRNRIVLIDASNTVWLRDFDTVRCRAV
jgi:hypothetical protein